MSDLLAVLVAVLLLGGNAFFVGAEFALVSTRREQIEPEVVAGTRGARTTLKALEQVSLMMAGAQLGITICSLGLGAVGEPAVAHLVERPFEAWGVPEQLLHPVAFALALAIVVVLHMVLGEMVPKNLALAGPARAALLLGPVLYAVVRALRPLIAALNWLSDRVLRALGVEPQDEVSSTATREQVQDLVSESHREGLLDEEERRLLSGALDFDERTASSVAMTVESLVTVTGRESVAELQALCARTGYSRFPVRDGRDWPGYVHVKDLVGVAPDRRDAALGTDSVRSLPVVAADAPLRDVLALMQREGAHLGRVVEGLERRTVGVVALEDVLEELVGEVHDAARQV